MYIFKQHFHKLEKIIELKDILPNRLLNVELPRWGKDPKSTKNSQALSLFALLESAGIKAVRKHVGEIDPWGRCYKENLLLS